MKEWKQKKNGLHRVHVGRYPDEKTSPLLQPLPRAPQLSETPPAAEVGQGRRGALVRPAPAGQARRAALHARRVRPADESSEAGKKKIQVSVRGP